jgi:hypothetical protein
MEKRDPRARRGGVGGVMLRMANVFFHIGMHKTATSWFQRQLFPNIDGASLISSKKMDEIAAALAAFDAQKFGNAAILLLSHEGLGGSISWDREPGETLERLSRNLAALMTLRPDAAVIIGYRKHEGWLASAFAQRAKQNRGVTWEAYLARFSPEELTWCRHLRLIESSCPSMFPYLYEELIESPETLVEDLCRFISRPLPSNIEALLRIARTRHRGAAWGRRSRRCLGPPSSLPICPPASA